MRRPIFSHTHKPFICDIIHHLDAKIINVETAENGQSAKWNTTAQ